jgi:Uma2 family endonuclease
VEILSASNRWPDVEEKRADYLRAGTRMAWVLDPREVVPGFRLELKEVFGQRPAG